MTTRTYSPSTRTAASTAAWVVLAVLLLFSIAAPLNQFKVPPIMPVLMQDLGLSVSGAGLLMSVYAVTGLILALPAGFILQRVGFKVTGLIAGGSILLGAALGALSPNGTALLLSRVIEGAGTSFMAVLAPALIGQWFDDSKRGTAMGVWSAWVPVGSATMLVLAPALVQGAGWRSVWWVGALYAAAVTVAYLLVARPAPATGRGRPAGQNPAPTTAQRREPVAAQSSVLRNRNVWLLAVAFGAMNAAAIGSGTYMPTFLSTVRGMSLAQAALLAAIPTVISIFSGPMGGVISDKLGSRRKPYLVAFALSVVLMPLYGFLTGAGFIALLVGASLVMGVIPTAIFAGAVESAGDKRQGGLAMGVIMVGQNGGMLLGPVIFGTLAQSAGWPVAFASLAVISLIGLAAGWLARVR